MVRRLGLGLLAVLAMSSASRAQDLQTRLGAADRRWEEYREALQSSSSAARSEALRVALADENVGIRNNALWFTLRNRTTLPVELVSDPGGRLDPGQMPTLEIERLGWDVDQRSFTGIVRSHGRRGSARGELAEGKMRIRYGQLGMPGGFGIDEDSVTARQKPTFRECTVSLEISATDRSLTGPLRCEGLSHTFKARLPLE